MVFRYRGIEVVVDTTQPAELQINGYQVSPSDIEAIERNLSDVMMSDGDQTIGDFRIRVIKGYEVAFVLGREDDLVVVTIAAVVPRQARYRLADVLKGLGKIAIIRGATGL